MKSKLKVQAGRPFIVGNFQDMGYEAWAVYDDSAEVFEVYGDKECSEWIGCADSPSECRKIALDWFEELMA